MNRTAESDRPVLLVTGGSRGIGAATCRLAGARGFDVAVNYRQDGGAAGAVVADIERAGGRAIAVQGDLAREDDVARMYDTIDARFGRLTHLACNAGVVTPMGRVETMQSQWLREVFEVNVYGTFYAVRAAIPRISTRHGGKGGAIVLVSSIVATLGAPDTYIWYAASKGAIDTMAKGLSVELAEDGIRVNAVTPGLTDTGVNPPERIARVAPMIPMKRAGEPPEIAECIVFLLSDAASYVTGANLRASGGR